MRVFNLACEQGHLFEGWFASSDEFDRQLQSKFVLCPVCESCAIEKRLHAPHILRGGGVAVKNSAVDMQTAQTETALIPAAQKCAQADEKSAPTSIDPRVELLKFAIAQKIRESTLNIGSKFAEEARAMHYEEKPFQAIRGQATASETRELIEEGIAVQAIPFDVDLPKLQ